MFHNMLKIKKIYEFLRMGRELEFCGFSVSAVRRTVNRLRGSVTRPGNSQLVDAVPKGIGVNLENLSRAFWAADFPSGLLQHLQNMLPFDLFQRRSICRWRFLPRRLSCAVHGPRRERNGAGDRIEVGNLGRKEVRPQRYGRNSGIARLLVQ